MASGAAALGGLAALALLAAACGGTVRSPTDPSPVPIGKALTFTEIQNGIFTPSCAKSGCHSSSAASGGLVLTAGRSYGQIVGRPAPEQPRLALVQPGSAAASYLLKKVRGDPDVTGGRMPLDGPPFLSPEQVAGLAAWIEAGAPNN